MSCVAREGSISRLGRGRRTASTTEITALDAQTLVRQLSKPAAIPGAPSMADVPVRSRSWTARTERLMSLVYDGSMQTSVNASGQTWQLHSHAKATSQIGRLLLGS